MPPEAGSISTEALVKLTSNQDLLVLVGMATRPGLRRFITYLEYTHYSPFDESGINEKFQLFITPWKGMPFMTVTIPMADRPKAEAIAKSCNMRIANGVPILMGGGEADEVFPFHTDNVFTIENAPGSELYSGPDAARKMLEEETAELDEFFRKQDLRKEAN